MNPFLRAITALNDSGVQYVVVGGLAAYLHGTQRMTLDLDVIIDLQPIPALSAIQALVKAGFQSRLPVDPSQFADPQIRDEWVRNRHMVVFSLIDSHHPGFAVDLFAESPVPFEPLFRSSQLVELEGAKVRICDIPSLIELKTHSGRPRDLLDVESLRKIQSTRDSDGRA